MEIKINQKMKKSVYKSGMLLSFAAIFLFTFSLTAQEVTKEFHKEFKSGTGTTLNINNRYGDVVIESWDKDQVVIDVKISVDLPNRSRAEKLLSYIDVQFSEGENLITAKTVIDDNFNYSGWGSGSKRFTIDYSVKMPAGNNLNLTNKYGNSDINNKINGLVNLDIKYGNLTVEKLTRGNEKPINKLNIGYGKASFDEAGWLDVYCRYSNDVKITKSQALLLDSKYSTVKISETSSVVGESRYDRVEIEKVKNLVLQSGYTAVNVGELSKKLDFQGSYSSLSVETIPAGFESIDVDVRYMEVKLGLSESANYILDAHTSYAGVKFREEKFKHEKHIVENNSTTLTGVVGTEAAPTAKVKVSASYGHVRLY
jgi:hypothetical protein